LGATRLEHISQGGHTVFTAFVSNQQRSTFGRLDYYMYDIGAISATLAGQVSAPLARAKEKRNVINPYAMD
jgi:hypothetical protein